MARAAPFATATRLIARIDNALVTVAALAILAIMLIVVVDVTARYLFNAPLSWSFDFISNYLMGASFFFALSETLRRDHHVNVDILYVHFPLRMRRMCKMVSWVLTSVLFALMAWLAAKAAVERFVNHDVIAGAIAWPTWIPAAIGAIGLVMMTLRLVFGSLALMLAVFAGRRLDTELVGHDVVAPAEAL
jgi:TRAP-type C4-dicarboxylate transport system permease small subunit